MLTCFVAVLTYLPVFTMQLDAIHCHTSNYIVYRFTLVIEQFLSNAKHSHTHQSQHMWASAHKARIISPCVEFGVLLTNIASAAVLLTVGVGCQVLTADVPVFRLPVHQCRGMLASTPCWPRSMTSSSS